MSSYGRTTSAAMPSISNFKGSELSGESKKSTQRIVPNEFELEYVNEEHIAEFAKALFEDPNNDPTEHIAAVTDFMPIMQKIKEKKPLGEFEGYSYHIARFPMMLIIFLIIGCELLLYVLVRQIVNIWEYFVQWRGVKRLLREKLRQANSYRQWVSAANRLDSYFGYNEWKDQIQFGFYDYNLIKKVKHDLKSLRSGSSANAQRLKNALHHCVKSNFAGFENTRLYSQTYFGTKKIVEQYIDEVIKSLEFSLTTESLSAKEKRKLFKNADENFGRTALCLSGGASFGYFHLGVVKALFEADLLPTVFTGTSAGGLIAALICVRNDEELKQVLTPELHTRLKACSDPFNVWFPRWWNTGARFDSCDWARKTQWITKGSLTFKEAYERTGRILNISVIPYDPHSPPKVLNYITAPDCVIWSAVIASAAVPGFLNPVVLMQKLKDGTIIPYNYGHRWKDGSLRTDIPIQQLNMHFNVKNTIVSQVNPHVHLFFYAPRGSIGRPVTHRQGMGWRGGFLFASTEQYLKLDLSKWLKWIRDLELLPRIADQDWSSIWLQKFEGNITIWPKTTILDFFYVVADPNAERLERMIRIGQRVTWPKLHMIENRLKIERAIQKGRESIRKELRQQRKNHAGVNDKISNNHDGYYSSIMDDTRIYNKHSESEESISSGSGSDMGIDSDGGNGNSVIKEENKLSFSDRTYTGSSSEEDDLNI
ncbi:7788_t:CDS:2 [Acaulospora morrowiae]|uniref:Patatin-like phospholipase domain-containing protein n=1 Tax=Acaulospora morrowiae TaxID=94023 RepID=A0A9N8VWW7_9GLOM|nr:7788_t:CDS:2 [Acaulospora morrowiae]